MNKIYALYLCIFLLAINTNNAMGSYMHTLSPILSQNILADTENDKIIPSDNEDEFALITPNDLKSDVVFTVVTLEAESPIDTTISFKQSKRNQRDKILVLNPFELEAAAMTYEQTILQLRSQLMIAIQNKDFYEIRRLLICACIQQKTKKDFLSPESIKLLDLSRIVCLAAVNGWTDIIKLILDRCGVPADEFLIGKHEWLVQELKINQTIEAAQTSKQQDSVVYLKQKSKL